MSETPRSHFDRAQGATAFDPEAALDAAIDGAPLAAPPERPPLDWRTPAVRWLRDKADLTLNSLHCGDGAGEIAAARRYANVLRAVADELSQATTEEPRG